MERLSFPTIEEIAEGVPTGEERDMLAALGRDLFQGYLVAKPGDPLPASALEQQALKSVLTNGGRSATAAQPDKWQKGAN